MEQGSEKKMDFEKYFCMKDISIELSNIVYDLVKEECEENQIALNCNDTVNIEIFEKYVDVYFTRSVCFEPNYLFKLKITMIARLPFNMEVKKDINWTDEIIDCALREKDNPLIMKVFSSISLLVSQISSTAGNAPIITPPNIIKD